VSPYYCKLRSKGTSQRQSISPFLSGTYRRLSRDSSGKMRVTTRRGRGNFSMRVIISPRALLARQFPACASRSSPSRKARRATRVHHPHSVPAGAAFNSIRSFPQQLKSRTQADQNPGAFMNSGRVLWFSSASACLLLSARQQGGIIEISATTRAYLSAVPGCAKFHPWAGAHSVKHPCRSADSDSSRDGAERQPRPVAWAGLGRPFGPAWHQTPPANPGRWPGLRWFAPSGL
jgi:hypothetical protein